MSKMPKLRFEKFSEEWHKKKLGELLEFKNGINASKEQYGKGIKFINVLDVLNNDYITYDNIIGKIDIDEQTLKKNIVEYGDVLFQRSSETREEVGTANVYLDKEKKATFGGFIIRGKKIGDYNPAFINKLLKTKMARKEIISRAGGSTRYNVGQEILKDVELLFPSDEEQQKIAQFFYLIDKKIEKQQEKVEVLKDYKKGMMQKIFSQEMRFKDGNGEDYREWRNYKIKDCFLERSERGFSNFELISVSMEKGVCKRSEIEGKDNSSEDKSNYKLVKENDIVYNSMRMWQGASGVSKYIGIVSPAYTVLKPKKNVYSDYFGYKFKTPDMINEFRKYSQGLTSDTWSLKYPQIKNIKISLPSLEEQKKIATFLLKFDQKLEKEQSKLIMLNTWKKGLLQQMFI
ncbi:restriction endonuclease subunit S [Clostridium combesii]|uniref:Restriction endonuclease subunit S n=1 Tax=Clostridium combesii TaxID=39481 RepID=A0A2G7HL50_9CLOT|nr:restriction endonuclease subunit S [Clostridium combesii]PIH05436.1 restriction endonuclease subunit S [Clostridium combesii]